jgi:putative transposase
LGISGVLIEISGACLIAGHAADASISTMPRQPRKVYPDIPHHVTQRGNRRERVFFSDSDRQAYLRWLGEYTQKFKIDVLAYCLMSNHVHLIMVPSTVDGLHRALKPLHMRYAQRINRAREWKGHVWQGRYFSSALDEAWFCAAVRYVERNPVRAQMVRQAEDYPWSSAGAHCGLLTDSLLNLHSPWYRRLSGITDWSAWLSEAERQEQLDRLRCHANKGLPCGSPEFIDQLERLTGYAIRNRPRGRPRKPEDRKG